MHECMMIEWVSKWMSVWVSVSVCLCECECPCVCVSVLFMAKARRKTFCALISCPCGSRPCLHTFPLSLLLPAPLGLIINWKICLFCKFAREQNQSVCMEFPNSCAYFSSLISCFVFLSVSASVFFAFYGISICRNPSGRSSAKAVRPCGNEGAGREGEKKRDKT